MTAEEFVADLDRRNQSVLKRLDPEATLKPEVSGHLTVLNLLKRGVSVALGEIAEHLVVGAILADHIEHVLDGRRAADGTRNRRTDRNARVRQAVGVRMDRLPMSPGAILEALQRQQTHP